VFLKRYEGDVADLNLSFTITDDVLGKAHEVSVPAGCACCARWGALLGCMGKGVAGCGEICWRRYQCVCNNGQQSVLFTRPFAYACPTQVDLAPNGHEVAVTSDNRLAYIHRVADYRLNRQIREPAAAFLRGLHELIQPEWVRMFNEEELQVSSG
jgi:hypothetical protein